VVNNVVQLRMQQRFPAADRDHGSAQIAQLIHPPQHLFGRHGLRKIIELVAVGAGQIAAPDRDQMRQQRMVRRHHGLQDLPQSMNVPFRRLKLLGRRNATDPVVIRN